MEVFYTKAILVRCKCDQSLAIPHCNFMLEVFLFQGNLTT